MTRRNLVSNPSFEVDNAGWTTTGAAGGVVRTAGTWGAGAWYGRTTAATTGATFLAMFGNTTYVIPAAAGDRAFASVKVRADNTGAEGVRVALVISFRNGAGGSLAVATGATAFLSATPQTLYAFANTPAPAGTASVRIDVQMTAADVVAGDQVGIDALDFRLNEPPDEYFDGSFSNAVFDGTAHASSSVRVDPIVLVHPKAWKSGGVRVAGRLYKCDEYGVRLEDLTDYIERGSVTWNADKGAGQKLLGTFRLNRRGLVRTYVDFVAPELTLEWNDGTVETKQYGLHLVEMPNDYLYQQYASQAYRGLDPTWFPFNSAVRDTINYASSDNVVSKMKDLIVASGWPRVEFPASSRTFGAAKSVYPGIRRYNYASDQLEAMNWYVPFADLAGVIRTSPYLDMSKAAPAITIDYEDFVGEWEVVPTTTTLANVVSVYKENTAGAGTPISAVAINADPGSRISTVYRPEILRELTNANIQTQAEADALVLSMLQESASFYRVISGTLSPGVWMEPYCAADVYLKHADWGDLSGRYYVREWSVGFTQSDAEVKVEMNRTVAFDFSEDI